MKILSNIRPNESPINGNGLNIGSAELPFDKIYVNEIVGKYQNSQLTISSDVNFTSVASLKGKSVATQEWATNNFATKDDAIIGHSLKVVGDRAVKPSVVLTDGDSNWSMDVAKASGSNAAITKYRLLTENTSVFELSQSGDIWLNGSVSQSSDLTKKDILSYEPKLGVNDIAEAPICYFSWKDRKDDVQHLGTIAQYWKEVAPECVRGEEGNMSMDYSTLGLVSSVITAREVVALKARIEELEKRVKELEG